MSQQISTYSSQARNIEKMRSEYSETATILNGDHQDFKETQYYKSSFYLSLQKYKKWLGVIVCSVLVVCLLIGIAVSQTQSRKDSANADQLIDSSTVAST